MDWITRCNRNHAQGFTCSRRLKSSQAASRRKATLCCVTDTGSKSSLLCQTPVWLRSSQVLPSSVWSGEALCSAHTASVGQQAPPVTAAAGKAAAPAPEPPQEVLHQLAGEKSTRWGHEIWRICGVLFSRMTLLEKWLFFNSLLVSPARFCVEFVTLLVTVIVIASTVLYPG